MSDVPDISLVPTEIVKLNYDQIGILLAVLNYATNEYEPDYHLDIDNGTICAPFLDGNGKTLRAKSLQKFLDDILVPEKFTKIFETK